jgi:hypothetical protein
MTRRSPGEGSIAKRRDGRWSGRYVANGKRRAVYARSLAVDHDHTTGQVRGLLCIRCNRAIGNLRDDPDLAIRAAAYLKRATERAA